MNFSLKKFAVASALTVLATAAHASLVFTVTKQTDQKVVITGSGTLDGVPATKNPHLLSFDGLVNGLVNMQGQNVFVNSTMKLGLVPFNYAAAIGPDFEGYSLQGLPTVYAGNLPGFGPFQPGAELTGQLVLATFSKATFAPAGTIGDVLWGIQGNLHKVGTFEVARAGTDVPEPGSLALIAGGLLAAVAMRRARRS